MSPRTRRRSQHPGTYGGQVGRVPIDLDAVVDHVMVDGERRPVTLLDRAVDTLRLGGFTKDVAARIGVRVETVREWERIGTATLVSLNEGSLRHSELTDAQRMAARFVVETSRAEAEGKALLLALADKVAAGGAQRTTTTEKTDEDGRVVERTTKIETVLPDGAMIRWRMERRWPEDFNRPAQVEVTGANGGAVLVDLPGSVAALYDELDRIRASDREAETRATTESAPEETTTG